MLGGVERRVWMGVSCVVFGVLVLRLWRREKVKLFEDGCDIVCRCEPSVLWMSGA